MESSSSIGREDLLCSICLDVFTEPVSIPCGHSFCMACIKKHWNSDDVCQCPLCMEKFFRKPELRVNTTFRIFVAKFKKIEVKHADEIEQSTVEPGEIPCDVCTGGKLKALKSCLVCQTSYCETHLEPHHIAQSLKKHKLMDPVENLEDWLSKKHNKLLELFCRTDKTCACQICPETDHRFHYVVSLEDECEERKVQLGVTKAEVQQLIHERAKKLQEIKLSVETSKRDAEREISDSVEVFTALVRSIEKSHAQLIGMITEKLKETEREAERIIDELRKEISQLTRRNDELDELLHTDNLIHVIQSFPTVSTPPHTEDWSGVSVYSDLSVGAVRRAVSRQEETLVMEMRKLCQAELRRIQQYAVDETLDPDTANPQLILSEDGKQVRYGQTRKSLPELPARFDRGVNVLGKQGFSSGRVYYEVQVEGKTDWDLGVAAESVKRKGMIILDPLNGYWSIALRDGQGYIACTTSSLRLSLKEKPQKVGVFVDYEEGLVSFYDVEARCHIYSFTGCTFTEKLHLFLSPSLSKRGKNSGPLTISNVSQR